MTDEKELTNNEIAFNIVKKHIFGRIVPNDYQTSWIQEAIKIALDKKDSKILSLRKVIEKKDEALKEIVAWYQNVCICRKTEGMGTNKLCPSCEAKEALKCGEGK